MEPRKKILVIDDDKDILFSAKIILEQGGYEVFLAADGKTGIEIWRSVCPDLAIVDMMMESWSEGFSVIERIRSMDSGKRKPLFMLSSIDLHGEYPPFKLASPLVDRVLHKPVKAEDLLAYVGNALGMEGKKNASLDFAHKPISK